jgi:1-phosphofructokinase
MVLCLGLSPALQRTLVLDTFSEGGVNRIREVFISPGGKSVNTGLALAKLGRTPVITGLNGGAEGRLVAEHLKRNGATCAFTRTPWSTRTCTTIVNEASGCITELVEEAGRPTRALLQAFERRNRALLRRARLCFICGTLPPGVPGDFWARFARAAHRGGIPLLIDSHAAPVMRVLASQPLLVKMNVQELEKTLAPCPSEAAVIRASRELLGGGAAWVLITNGVEPAILTGRDRSAWRVTPPKVSGVRSPVGSGDCVNAGIVDALLGGQQMPTAVRFGLGCGTANALTYCPADFDPARARALASACTVQQLRKK